MNATPDRASRPHLSDEVAGHLRSAIMSGELAAGDFIRIDRVAEDLSLSATPVREALLVLRAEGFVELRPNRGFEILGISSTDVRDLFAAQAFLYGEVAARAAAVASDAETRALGELHDGFLRAASTRDYPELFRVNYRFTREVSRISKATKLSLLFGIAARYVPRSLFEAMVRNDSYWITAEAGASSHILAAIRAHDQDWARRESSSHVSAVGEMMVKYMETTSTFLARPASTTGSASS